MSMYIFNHKLWLACDPLMKNGYLIIKQKKKFSDYQRVNILKGFKNDLIAGDI